MSDALSNLVAARFHAFAAPYLAAPGDSFAYRLKVDHTMRVYAIADAIARAERLPEPLPLACRIAALLHDVGRFPQYEMFRTFRDAQSANHALLSVRHALRAGLLEGVPKEIRHLAIGAVHLHNKRTLPPLRSGNLAAVARIVRDSDKLDIFQVMIDHFAQKDPKHPEVALDVRDEPGAYTPLVLKDVMGRHSGDYRNIVYVNDFKIMVIGWLYDMNFRTSCQLLSDRGYLETIFDSMPQDEPICRFREQIRGDLAERLNRA